MTLEEERELRYSVSSAPLSADGLAGLLMSPSEILEENRRYAEVRRREPRLMLKAEEIPISYGELSKEFLWRECVNRILVQRMRKDLTTSLWPEVK